MFEIRGVGAEVMAAFSMRSAEIGAALAERDAASAAEKQMAALYSNEATTAAHHASLVADGGETAINTGFGAEARLARIAQAEAKAAYPAHRLRLDMQGESAAARAVAHAAGKLGKRQSVFSGAALHEEAGRIGLGRISCSQIGAAIETARKEGDLIDRTFEDRRGAEFAGFTTRKNIEAERHGAFAPIASELSRNITIHMGHFSTTINSNAARTRPRFAYASSRRVLSAVE